MYLYTKMIKGWIVFKLSQQYTRFMHLELAKLEHAEAISKKLIDNLI